MKNIFILFILVLIFACNKKDVIAPATNTNIQGIWMDTLDRNIGYFAGSTNQLTFNKDSFYFKTYSFTDEVLISCIQATSYKYYVKGKFNITTDSLNTTGIYCDSNYNEKLFSECPGIIPIGTYTNSYKVFFKNGKLQLLKSNFQMELFKKK